MDPGGLIWVIPAQDILAAANRKAKLVETHAHQAAHRFLSRAGEEVQRRLAAEVKEGYHRLLTSLQGFRSTAQTVQTHWATRELEPWWDKPSELREYQATLLHSLMVDGDQEAEAGRLTANQGMAPQMDEDPLPSSPGKTSHTPASTPRDEGRPWRAASEMESVLGEMAAPQESKGWVEKGQVEDVAPDRTAATHDGRVAVGETLQGELVRDATSFFEGQVELVIPPPVTAAKVTELYNHLQSTPDCKVLGCAGSWEQGAVVTIEVERPLPLVSFLSGISTAEVVPPKGGKKDDSVLPRVSLRFSAQDVPLGQ